MGSYCSVHNNTDMDMYIKYGVNTKALAIASLIAGVLSFPFSGGTSIALGAASLGLGIASFAIQKIDDDLRKEGYSKIEPGGTYTSEKVTLSLYFQANIVMVRRINNDKVRIKTCALPVWSGPTDDSVNRYEATDCSFDEQMFG